MAKPTPTQEELDRIALGEHVMVKEPDGSGLENPPERPPTEPPGTEPDPKKKHMEAKPAHGSGYQTRHMTPQPKPSDDD